MKNFVANTLLLDQIESQLLRKLKADCPNDICRTALALETTAIYEWADVPT